MRYIGTDGNLTTCVVSRFGNSPQPPNRLAAHLCTETSLLQSYDIVIRYLNQVGLAAEPFNCPVTDRYR